MRIQIWNMDIFICACNILYYDIHILLSDEQSDKTRTMSFVRVSQMTASSMITMRPTNHLSLSARTPYNSSPTNHHHLPLSARTPFNSSPTNHHHLRLSARTPYNSTQYPAGVTYPNMDPVRYVLKLWVMLKHLKQHVKKCLKKTNING